MSLINLLGVLKHPTKPSRFRSWCSRSGGSGPFQVQVRNICGSEVVFLFWCHFSPIPTSCVVLWWSAPVCVAVWSSQASEKIWGVGHICLLSKWLFLSRPHFRFLLGFYLRFQFSKKGWGDGLIIFGSLVGSSSHWGCLHCPHFPTFSSIHWILDWIGHASRGLEFSVHTRCQGLYL